MRTQDKLEADRILEEVRQSIDPTLYAEFDAVDSDGDRSISDVYSDRFYFYSVNPLGFAKAMRDYYAPNI